MSEPNQEAEQTPTTTELDGSDLANYRPSRRVDKIDRSEEGIVERIRERVSDEITSVAESISKGSPLDPMGTIPENHFYHVFLPFFARTGNPYNVNLGNWASKAGSYFSEMKVINEKGEVVVTVPPILHRDAVKPYDTDIDDHFSAGMNLVRVKSRIHPKMGLSELRRMLDHRLDAMIVGNVDVLGYVKRWNDIFKHYEYPLIVVEGAREQIGVPDDYEPGTKWSNSGKPTETTSVSISTTEESEIVRGGVVKTTIHEDEYGDID